MNITTRKTRICTLETLDEELKAAIRVHAAKHGWNDIETDILMCCETISVHQKRSFGGGIKTSLSAVYVTPKWLVWADSTDRNDACVGMTQLKYMNMPEDLLTGTYAVSPDQGRNIAEQYADENETGFTFIVLDSEADGERFRKVLKEALYKASRLNWA